MMQNCLIHREPIEIKREPENGRPGFELMASLSSIRLRVVAEDGKEDTLNVIPSATMRAIGRNIGNDVSFGIEVASTPGPGQSYRVFIAGRTAPHSVNYGNLVDLTLIEAQSR